MKRLKVVWRVTIPEERSELPKTTSAQHCELCFMPLSTALPAGTGIETRSTLQDITKTINCTLSEGILGYRDHQLMVQDVPIQQTKQSQIVRALQESELHSSH
jgi:hypothetical protein